MKILNTFILLVISLNLFAQYTSWNEYKLKEHWKSNGADELEGIYEWVRISSDGPIYVYGLLKTQSGYDLIFLNMRTGPNVLGLETGEISAKLTPTATKNCFTGEGTVYFGETMVKSSFYWTFERGLMTKTGVVSKHTSSYTKTYPTTYDKILKPNEYEIVASSATGFGIASTGIIVTNYHVIDGAKTIKVRGINSDFNKTYKAKVLVSDKNNDLALIQIDDYGFTSLGIIPFTVKTTLGGVGENIFVLGYPLRASMGDEIKLTNGIISCRTGFQGDITSYQISAPVQPGNSGGPLFNSQGNLIGIITAKHVEAENASYAVKTSYLTNLIELLPSPPKLQTVNSLTGKPLTQQVEIAKKFVYIIETE